MFVGACSADQSIHMEKDIDQAMLILTFSDFELCLLWPWEMSYVESESAVDVDGKKGAGPWHFGKTEQFKLISWK